MKRAVIMIDNRMDADATLDAMGGRFVEAWRSGKSSDPLATFVFSSPAQLFSVISPKRWELIERLQAAGPLGIQGLARVLERDVKRVHEDVTTLLEWGIVERDDHGKVPYDVIHADFDLRAVA
jgi:predicted transcriptional regulator